MVMKKNAMRRNLRQSILKSLGRYIAITAIITLGAGLFLGLVMTKTDMVATGQQYTREQNMFDLRMISNYGWSEEFVEEFAALPGVEAAEGQIYLDLIAKLGEEKEAVFRFYSIPRTINRLALRSGTMPREEGECLADGYLYDESILGKQIHLSDTNEEDSLDSMKHKTFTVVGLVSSPLYMDMNRGTTSIGSGTLENYFFVPEEAFDVDYYTEIDLKLEGEYAIYSQEYSDFLDKSIDALEADAEALSQRRFDELKAEIEEEYAEGYQEYLDGLKEFEEGKAEAEQELADAEAELKDAQKKVDDGYDQLLKADNEIQSGYKQIEAARTDLYNNRVTLNQQLQQMEANLPLAESDLARVEQIIGMSSGALEGELSNAQKILAGAQQSLAGAQQTLAAVEAAYSAVQNDPEATEGQRLAAALAVEDAQAAVAGAQLAVTTAQQRVDTLNGLKETIGPAINALNYLMGMKNQLTGGLAQIEAGFVELEKKYAELQDAEYKVDVKWGEWAKGRDELAEGWKEFEEAKIEVAEELAEAEAELKDAEEDLAEARQEIDDMEAPDLYILDRESNVGYNNLSSSSDIVQGVSRVFPVFFLLIASLVCITTMTRMIDEERTQIGTLKALGYTSGEIVSKYLIYSGSGAVIGCILGILLGCSIFPMIIWDAYKIMLYIQPDIVLTVDWPLAIAVSAAYLAVMLAVTWYCCYKTLQEEPAQLIRPKAPEAGKSILLEKLPIWQKLKFLNKVAIRNIFRYRQRLAMMLIGIGGCTALLIAGFGLRDSVVNIVDYQFRDVTHYDISVYFREALTEKQKQKFEAALKGKVRNYMYYHQSSVEIDTGKGVKEIYMICGDSGLADFITLREEKNQIALPERNEVVLSVGAAENLGIHPGDMVTVRSADMEEMELKVSGIYDNYVYNYCIVSPDTVQENWGYLPELQMAFLAAEEGVDVHAVGAAVTDLDSVLNVTVSEDIAVMVGSMMDALDLVVMVAVVCAALLAVIVLYNLTNININERIREIATIKVLGFNASETASYVFKENMVLTVAGSLFGLGMGRLLLEFIMTQVKIDMVWFRAVLTPASCVLAVVITLLSAVAVEFIFYFKLEKINMAEALKSVE